ncbi:AAA family ATPase [Sphaerisporangium sp. NPDC088356]|uniref:AAA family ATPase n=1 Tax=Sphaerisporangium sp. NPDC088356 TaxID=3154871 RepID=UPI00343ADA5C
MYLEQLEIDRFRAYRHANVSFPEHGLLLIAGANNTGKSSFLTALDVVGGLGVTSEMYHGGGVPPLLKARFRLSEDERAFIIASLALTSLESDEFRWLEWEFAVSPKGERMAARISTSRSNGQAHVIAEVVQNPNDNLWDVNLIAGLNNYQIAGQDFWQVNTRLRTGGTPQSLEDISIPELSSIISQLQEWRKRFFHFPAHRPGTARSQNLSSVEYLDPTGSNLTAVLLNINTNHPDLWNELQELIRQIVPDVGQLRVPTRGSQMEITFRDPYVDDLHHNIKDLGTGVEQLLLALVVGLTHPTPAVVAIEEPETALHPSAQRALLGLLRSWSHDRLFVVTTHSPVFLDTSEGAAKILAVRREGGASTIEHASSTVGSVLGELGVRLSDVLSADRILLVEGPSDREILSVWYPQILTDPRIAVILGGGGENVKYASVLQSWLDTADRLGGRRVLYVRDRDELPDRLLAELDKSQSAFVLPRRELENYLLAPEAIARVLETYGNCSGLTKEMVTSTIKEAANALRSNVILKRVCWELVPVRLVDNSLRTKLAKRQASPDELIEAVVERIPERPSIAHKIKDSWAHAEVETNARWAEHWEEMAPGADMLDAIWKKFVGRRYDKQVDGKKLAQNLGQAPTELAEVMERFLSRD